MYEANPLEKTLDLLKSNYLVSLIGYKGLYRNETIAKIKLGSLLLVFFAI